MYGSNFSRIQLVKNLLESTDLRHRRAEVFEQLLGDLARDALYGHEGLRGRLREVLRILEARVNQCLGSRPADPFDGGELLEDPRAVDLRRLELEEPSLDPFVSGAQLERLREGALRIVVAPDPQEDVPLGGPCFLVVGIELREPFERFEGGLRLALLEQDVPAVQECGCISRLHTEDEIEAVQGLLRLPPPPIGHGLADQRVHVARLDLEDLVEEVQGLRVVPTRARDEGAAQEAGYVHADILDLLS